MSGWALQKPHDEESANISLSTEYAQSFKNSALTKALFDCYPTQNYTTMSIKGSAVADRSANDLVADWFYLPSNYQGTLYVNPSIQNVTTALTVNYLSDGLAPGLFLSLRAPVTWTRWN